MTFPSPAVLSAALILGGAGQVAAQTRSLLQDSTLDNLRHPPNYQTASFGSLGAVTKVGAGARTMILIPGLGFGGGVFDELMARFSDQFTMYAVTLPGFGGTAAPPIPAGTSFGEVPWTKSAEQAILALMNQERIERATLVAHWILAPQIAFRLALDHPDRFDAVVLIGAAAKSYYSGFPQMRTWSLEQRAQAADRLGSSWFKTVTKRTWDDNNYMSYDYAVNPRRGLFLWREAASPPLQVWIRYLLEFYCLDPTLDLGRLTVPTLVVKPGFDDPGYYVEDKRDYMKTLTQDSWDGVDRLSPLLELVTIPRSRLFIMYDQPEALDRVIRAFLAKHHGA